MNKHFITAGIAFGLLLIGATIETMGAGKPAHADTVKAKRTTSVMASPGEQSRVVTRVHSGDSLTVLNKKGRWLKVRVNGRTGWITRTNVVARQARTKVRTNRRRAFVEGRSRKRNKRKAAPRDRVGADAVSDRDNGGFEDEGFEDEGFEEEFDDDFDDQDFEEEEEVEEPRDNSVVALATTKLFRKKSRRSRTVHRARAGDRLTVIRRDQKWLKVESDDGEVGWVRAKDVDDGMYRYDKVGTRYYAGIGYVSFGQAFNTPNECDLCNYELSTGAAAINAGVDVIYDYSKEYLLGVDANYQYTRAVPGIRFQTDMVATDIGFQVHNIDAGARGGYKLGKATGMAAYARVGYLYHRFGVNDVENFDVNLAKLPSEILSGVTIGAMLDVPRFNPKLAFRLGVNMLLSGERVQTAGLEDGQVSTASALWGIARVDYKWKPDMKLTGQYFYNQATTSWNGQAEDSQRDHNAASAKREDLSHTLIVGVSKAL